MSIAIITGITGQDGSYMAELLLSKEYRVFGVVRSICNAQNLLSEPLKESVELVEWDMLDQEQIIQILTKCKPQEIYNFAAYSSGAGMFDDPVSIAEVNGLAVVRILEAICKVDNRIRLCQASSREIFGDAIESPQVESTRTNPRSPYGAAKLYADSMIRIYRQHYGIYACSAILFNHESPRRGLEFVTRKITNEAAKIKLGLANELHLGNLDAERDWGFAGDYVKAMWSMLQNDDASDYIIATGELHTVREFCDIAFDYLGLNFRDYVRVSTSAYRSKEDVPLIGCIDKAKVELNWKPEINFKDLVRMMVDADLEKLKADINN
jgi:GDPmannose 4,6-dehydratase